MKPFIIIPTLFVLTACGGSGSSDVDRIIEILTQEEAEGVRAISGSTNAALTEIILDTEDGVLTVPIDTDLAEGSFLGGFEQSDSDFIFAFVSEGEASIATVGAYGPFDDQGTGIAFARTVDSTLPTDGTATFSGDYLSILTTTDGETADGVGFVGTARLDVNFETQKVSGEITDRASQNLVDVGGVLPDLMVADIVLQETDITDAGTFAGTTSGGAVTNPTEFLGDSVVADNGYTGLFAGDEASESVGSVSLTHTFPENVFEELGVFIVSQ